MKNKKEKGGERKVTEEEKGKGDEGRGEWNAGQGAALTAEMGRAAERRDCREGEAGAGEGRQAVFWRILGSSWGGRLCGRHAPVHLALRISVSQ